MINVFRKIKLPLLILFLLLNTLSCKVIFWGQDLGKLNKDFVTTCYFYRDSTADSPSIKIDYMIGETYSIPEFNGKLSFSVLNIMLFLAFIMLRYVPSIVLW